MAESIARVTCEKCGRTLHQILVDPTEADMRLAQAQLKVALDGHQCIRRGLATAGALLLAVLLALPVFAADCPTKGDPAKPFTTWGQKCGKATGSCVEPYACLWPPDCRCDLPPLGMHRDPAREGWKKGAAR